MAEEIQQQAGGQQRDYIKPGTVTAPEFPEGLDWVNTNRPLTIRELRGKVVLLDFWTHCCINCLHALDDLKRLERKYPAELVVIGVHSAKFDREKQTESIRQAVLRNGIEHAVVNDHEMQIWSEYAVSAWPSFILIDPLGKVFGTHSGEQVFDLFDGVISQMSEHYSAEGSMVLGALANSAEALKEPQSMLSFPGKVLADPKGGRLFIADSNHNRIVVASLQDGAVSHVVGTGDAGLADGSLSAACFCHPQGMAIDGDILYVADTDNHAVRKIDLLAGVVSTVAGDGVQDTQWDSTPAPLEGRRLNSPWDLELEHGVLFVAMAGNHQIFGIDIEGGFIAGHAGSGREDHLDGPLLAAALAQPSGLSSDGESLFVADSEVSSIRAVDLDPRGGHVKTVVGEGLFDFGDVDGVGKDVRLQHPLGVVFAEKRLFVADTYNNKIKSIGLPTRNARTLAGSGAAGLIDGDAVEAQFNEPTGLSYANGKLYVADTNNHAIRVVDVATGSVSTFELTGLSKLVRSPAAPAVLEEQTVTAGTVTIRVTVELPPNHHISSETSSGVTLRAGETVLPTVLRDGVAEFSIDVVEAEMVRIEAVVYYCTRGRESVCLYHAETLELPLRVGVNSPSEITLTISPRGR
jgi:sugar lactone lactonase YvrE